MSAPRRLWSGDWQHESDALSEELANRRAALGARPAIPAPAEPEPPPARPPLTQRLLLALRSGLKSLPNPKVGPRLRRALPIALAALLILAAGAYGLSAVLGSSGQSPTPAVSKPSGPIYWLGMQIESVSPGQLVVDTVSAGSPAEAAGIEPGDVLAEVNGKTVNRANDVARALGRLRSGDHVDIQVDRGSTTVITQATLTTPPSSKP